MERSRFTRHTGSLHLIVAVVAIAVLGCSQPNATAGPTNAGPTVAPPTATGPAGTPSQALLNLANEACLAAQFPNCVDDIVAAAQATAGSLVAICEYTDQTGRIVAIAAEGEAETACSANAASPLARVVGVLRLP